MSIVQKFVVTVLVIVLGMVFGYACRKLRLLGDRTARALMTAVAVFGYSVLSMLTIWPIRLVASDAWLPVLGAVHLVMMSLLCLAIGRLVGGDRGDTGLLGLAGGAGNTGMTMGAFIIYLLFNEQGLGLANVYCVMWTPMVVLVMYPIARRYGGSSPPMPLWRLLAISLLDWRSVGVILTLGGLGLSLWEVPRPQAIGDYCIVDVLAYATTAAAYFSIGLRLRARHILAVRRMILALAACRFVLGAAVGWGLWAITLLTAWPLAGMSKEVFIIESFVPTAVTMVAVANMFDLKPESASVLFVVNTMMYIVLVLPLVLWIWG